MINILILGAVICAMVIAYIFYARYEYRKKIHEIVMTSFFTVNVVCNREEASEILDRHYTLSMADKARMVKWCADGIVYSEKTNQLYPDDVPAILADADKREAKYSKLIEKYDMEF